MASVLIRLKSKDKASNEIAGTGNCQRPCAPPAPAPHTPGFDWAGLHPVSLPQRYVSLAEVTNEVLNPSIRIPLLEWTLPLTVMPVPYQELAFERNEYWAKEGCPY